MAEVQMGERVMKMPSPEQTHTEARVHIVVAKTDEALAALLKMLTLFAMLCGIPLTAWVWDTVIFK